MVYFEDLSNKEKEELKVYEGYDSHKFTWIPQISCYNYGYYVGIKRKTKAMPDCILGISDDDASTVWYIVNRNEVVQFGYSNGGIPNIVHLGTSY